MADTKPYGEPRPEYPKLEMLAFNPADWERCQAAATDLANATISTIGSKVSAFALTACARLLTIARTVEAIRAEVVEQRYLIMRIRARLNL